MGATADGWNLAVSTDGGQSFTPVTTVTPAYPLIIAAQPAWGGDHAAAGWQRYGADLAAFAGQTAILRVAFRSDGATELSGVSIDDLVVGEPLVIPLEIDAAVLPDVLAGAELSAPLTRTGGSAGATWSLVPGGAADAWLTIDPATGFLHGTAPREAGPVSVTVRVAEPTLPSNFAERTFTFEVLPDAYYTGFEGACPAGWTLTGTWACGVPMFVGAPTAFAGTQCLATGIGRSYDSDQAWALTTATSPDFDLSGLTSPTLTFRMWVDTEGGSYDGANLQISADGGLTYALVDPIDPVYPLTVAGQPAWGGRQGELGWQAVEADLSAYAGQTVRLRFAFRSDSSGNFAGVFIDDVLVR